MDMLEGLINRLTCCVIANLHPDLGAADMLVGYTGYLNQAYTVNPARSFMVVRGLTYYLLPMQFYRILLEHCGGMIDGCWWAGGRMTTLRRHRGKRNDAIQLYFTVVN
jgi:hypothetical protein